MTRLSFDGVLGTNYTPTHDERRVLATLIESKEQELVSLNDIIVPLLARRDKLNDDILAHKELLTPARRLPPELLSEVFAHSVNHLPLVRGESDQELHRFAIPSVKQAPLVLGRICRRWREIALSTPLLWSTISIPRRFSADGVQEWISRAGSYNLSFSVVLNRRNIKASNVMASHQRRWINVEIGFDAKCGPKFVKSLLPEYHSLQTLEISRWISPSADIPLIIRSAPNLRGLIVRDPTFKIITLDDSAPLCLRKIDVRGKLRMFSTELLRLLHLSPAVQAISANLLNKFEHDDQHRDILTLPALKQMDITDYEQESRNTCVLERLCAPALEEFWFHAFPSWGGHLRAPQIRSLLQRSCPPLKVLRVSGGCQIPSVEILGCLPFLPLLSILHLEQLEGEFDGLINALTGPIPPSIDHLSGCICPELNEIYFKPTNGHGTTSELVINMILSRSPSGTSKLAHVTVLSCQESEVLTDRRIVDCVENGLKFVGGKLNG